MWTGQIRNPELPLYNTALAYSIDGAVDPETFRAAFDRLVTGNQALRLTVTEVAGTPELCEIAAPWPRAGFADLSDHPQAFEEAQAWIRDDARQRFEMGRCLYRAHLFGLGPERFLWYLNQHHLICDAQSCVLLWKRLSDLYQATTGTTGGDLPPNWPDFSEHAKLVRSDTAVHVRKRAEGYWQRQLQEPLEPTRFYGPLPARRQGLAERVEVDMTTARMEALERLATDPRLGAINRDLGLFSVCTAILLALVHRISGKSSVRVGFPSQSRPTPQSRQTTGLFLEIAALQVALEGQVNYLELVRSVHAESLASLKHLPPGISSAGTGTAFDLLVNYFRMETPAFAGIPSEARWIDTGAIDPSHTLRLQIYEFNVTGTLSLCFDLARELFDHTQRRRLADQFLRLFDQCTADPEAPINALSLATETEIDRFAHRFNARLQEPAATTTATALLNTAIASTDGRALAIVESDGQGDWHNGLSYAALDARVAALAKHLQQLDYEPDTRLAIYMHRSVDMLVSVLAVLRAGYAYVPIEVNNPVEYARLVLADSDAPLLLSDNNLVDRLGQIELPTLMLDQFTWPETTAQPDPRPRETSVAPEDLAYIIYTSGSTGRPKGVMVEQRSLANYLSWAVGTYATDGPTSFPFYSSVAFDLTVTSMFVPLLSGGTVRVYPEQDAGARLEILDVARDDVVEVIKLTPAHLSVLLETDYQPARLRKLILGGEDLKRSLAVRTLSKLGENVEIYNEYGPTEATVGCMIHRFDPATDPEQSVPIGRPISGASVYVLDAYGHPTAQGVVGEMSLGGSGVARGYLGMPERTAERFASDPFNPGGRLYRSGDLARWSENGRLQFLGRDDDQVKVGGIRLELGDIEAKLSAHPQISQCVVVLDQGRAVDRWQPEATHCNRCGIESRYPGISMDEDGVCTVCRDFERHRHEVDPYFADLPELREALATASRRRRGDYDCLMLLSGGKDSTYALCQLVDMGAQVLAFTLDNGYISDQAKANMERVTRHLGVELITGSTPYMGEIFADSLRHFSNVCNGCFKTLYTLSMRVAKERGIPMIVTGIARGQLFETRLVDMFEARVFDPEIVDERVLAARKAYHQMEDAVSRCLDVSVFQDDRIFEEITFIDFYRYTDVRLEDMLRYLEQQVPWQRPTDTGRSSNCRINDVGIYIHKKERGHHNYSLPYSWDVRLGHKTRAASMAELDDDIDENHVRRVLDEIGYQPSEEATTDRRLTAYYVAEEELEESTLRKYLADQLPNFAVPPHLLRLPSLPLSPNGKVDRAGLPTPGDLAPRRGRAPRNSTESTLATIWARVLRLGEISIDDNFFQLGGDSIACIQVVAAANQEGLRLSALQLFRAPTIAALANEVGDAAEVDGASTNTIASHRKWISDQAYDELLDQYGE